MSPTGAQLACDWCLGKHLSAPLWQEMKAPLAYVLLVTRGLQPVKGRLANSDDLSVPPQPPSFFRAICQCISYHLTVSTEDVVGIMCQFWKHLGCRFTFSWLIWWWCAVMYVTAFSAFLTHMREYHHKEWAWLQCWLELLHQLQTVCQSNFLN